MSRTHAAPLLDRNAQNLPVPLGDMAPARASPRRRRGGPRLHLPGMAAGVGVVCGVTGLGLLLSPAPVAVSLLGDRLQVGGMVLTAVGPTAGSQPLRYQGEASYVLAEHSDGTTLAAAAWVSGGTRSTGLCRLRKDGARLIDECDFTLGSAHLTSVDVLEPARGSVWQRTYSDGARATIAVSPDGGAVPVPFPIGR